MLPQRAFGYAGVMKIAYQTVIAGLRAELDKLDFERYSLVSFRGKPVMKRGFFPGGNGLFEGENAGRLPVGGTLVLGSNFSAAWMARCRKEDQGQGAP